MQTLRFGFSPCPNDTFAFHALVHDLVQAPFRVEPVLLDIEELNRRALAGELELTKVSYGALPRLERRYRLLRSGSALGRGCGPLVVARAEMTLAEAATARIAIPGRETTAFLLLSLAAGAAAGGAAHAPRRGLSGELVETRYDRILGAVERGEVDAGLIIHESRFTYRDHGLTLVADLGDWWEHETGLPIPLGAILARRDLDDATAAAAEAAIRASVRHAFAHPQDSRAYVRAHAQELSDEVCDAHIDLYVNEFTIDLGDEGLAAVEGLTRRAVPA